MEHWVIFRVEGAIPDGAVIDVARSKRGRYVIEDVVELVLNTSEYETIWIVTVEI